MGMKQVTTGCLNMKYLKIGEIMRFQIYDCDLRECLLVISISRIEIRFIRSCHRRMEVNFVV